MPDEVVVQIKSDVDILSARQQARALAAGLRLSSGEVTLVATAISEVARNIVSYAKRGDIVLRRVTKGRARGILIIARDKGPGIPNIARAMEDGFTTSGGLGLGLPGSKRLMDEFDITSEVGKGTTITMVKWER
jgi:serine/threonine-protein kinase RsbT